MTDAPQFTTTRLFLWTLYFATFAAIFSLLPATSVSFGAATVAAVLFAIVDLKLNKRFGGLLGISYFACALSYVVAIGFVVLLLFPPTTPPKPPLPLVQEIARAMALIFLYLATIVACTLTSTGIALISARHRREARWLLLVNTPGILLSIYVVVGIVYGMITD